MRYAKVIIGLAALAFAPLSAQAQSATGIFSDRVRDVSDLVLLENGTVFALERAQGRVVQMDDRGLDGRADGTRRLPGQFDTPQSLVMQDGRLFVADRLGVWGLRREGGAERIAALDKSGAEGPIFLAAGDNPGTLVIGLTRAGDAHLITLDIATGRAAPLAKTAGTLRALARLPNAGLWTSVELPDGTYRVSPALSETGETTDLAVQDFAVLPDSRLDSTLLAILMDGRVAALPMSFGAPRGPGETLLSAPRKGRTAPTQAPRSALAADGRGVFVFDRQAKRLRLIRIAPVIPDVSPVSQDDSSPDP